MASWSQYFSTQSEYERFRNWFTNSSYQDSQYALSVWRNRGSRGSSGSSGNNDYDYNDDNHRDSGDSSGNNDYGYDGGDQVNQSPVSGSGSSNIDMEKMVNIGIAIMILNLIISIFKK